MFSLIVGTNTDRNVSLRYKTDKERKTVIYRAKYIKQTRNQHHVVTVILNQFNDKTFQGKSPKYGVFVSKLKLWGQKTYWVTLGIFRPNSS